MALALASVPLLTTPAAWAIDQYLNDFNGLYGTTGSVLDSCLVCHVTPTGGARNVYGNDFATAKLSNDPAGVQAALAAIEPDDSDLDTIINIDEILAGTFPGDCTDPDPAGCPGGEPPPDDPTTITEGPTLMGCYAWSRFPDERLALSIKRYGGLVPNGTRRGGKDANSWSWACHSSRSSVCV